MVYSGQREPHTFPLQKCLVNGLKGRHSFDNGEYGPSTVAKDIAAYYE